MSQTTDADNAPTLFGHPTGLFNLFFAEMWERFSYYGMRALLVFYMIKGFLSYDDGDAYKVYGAYTALVYMTPFFGGMIADKLLGARRAVILGGLLMAAGHLLMTIETSAFFFTALAFLIVGNGFFKPNISTIVGTLYKQGDVRRDGGFTIFYMGINLGAAMAPLLCGYVGETYGWHYGFGLATVGMMIGLAVFIVPSKVAQFLILIGALATSVTMVYFQKDNSILLLMVNGFVALALVLAGVAAFTALGRGGLPESAGAPPDEEKLKKPFFGLRADHAVYIGTLVAVPFLALFVWSVRSVRVIPASWLEPLTEGGAFLNLIGTFLAGMATLPGLLLIVAGVGGFAYLFRESLRCESEVEKHRLWVILILMFFSMLFWAFFEQAGSSVNNFTDRNIDRVFEDRRVTESDVGQTIAFRLEPRPKESELQKLPLLSQGQLGYEVGGSPFNMTRLTDMRNGAIALGKKKIKAEERQASMEARTTKLTILPAHVGMQLGGTEVPASVFQSANAIFILIFGLIFTALWTFLGKRNMEPSTTVKFALGLGQLGLGFVAMWYGASKGADARGMVGMHWVLIGYLLHTTGELCLSPVGLSMVTKLSPKRLVSTAMGAWFLATAFSNLLAAIIATFTGVSHGGEEGAIPVPSETVNVYGDVFGTIGATAIGCAVLCFALSPILTRWMHTEADNGTTARAIVVKDDSDS